MDKPVALLARAKLNLSLAVTGRRADGMHTLDTVMQSVSLANRLTVERAKELSLSCDDKALPTDEKNTAYRAAEVFFRETGVSGGARIEIEKRIPYEAGLGSASADAAGVLIALDRLCETRLSRETLCRLALLVGADVPFCVVGGACRATGVGEILTPVSPLQTGAFLIVKPPHGVSTPAAYRAVDALVAPALPDGERMAKAVAAGELAVVGALCENTFTACCGDEESFEILKALREAGALGASMSGSGSALFGLFESEETAASALPLLQKEGRFAAVALPVSAGVTILE